MRGEVLRSTLSRETPAVLIVGAGPVGLALAIELGQRGIRCVVLERHDRVGRAPRAKTTHVRTREHLRRWGIAEDLAAASPLGIDYPSDVIFVTRLAGYKLAQFKNAFHCAPGRNALYSEHAQWIPQYTLEEILRRHAQRLPNVEIRFNCEFLSAVQDTEHVTTRFRDLERNVEETLESDYLVGADGARSAVRSLIGARMQGAYGLSRNYNFVFHAPGLARAHQHGPGIMYWQVNADLPSLLGPMDSGDTWFFMPTRLPEGMKLSKADAATAIRRATGIDMPFEVVHSDEWVASQLIADSYRDRRIFLAGDACHLHPPFGGYGMNMGVADGVDLGWKLAAVIQGWGGPHLLDSYARERRPTHEYVIGEAVANHSALADTFWEEGLDAPTEEGARIRARVGERIEKTKAREFCNLGVVLGYRYEDSPVIVSDGSEPPLRSHNHYEPSSHPGCVAPHAWFDDATSLYDRFGIGFTLLTKLSASHPDVERASADARAAGIPLHTIEIQSSAIDALYPTAYTLIRPDQHVAWRGDTWLGASVLNRISGHADPTVVQPREQA
jgi:2-polyprenyl-6-methoxyphenol hydroxylase-like FAD-dependent oxidoreductase